MLATMTQTQTRPVVVVTEGSARGPLDWLKGEAEVLEVGLGTPGLDAALARAEGLIVRTYTKVTAEFLTRCPKLRVVGRGGVGLENIDVPACRARGVEVVYTPDANTLAVGDFVFGAILRLIRPWAEFSAAAYPPAEFKRVRDTLRGRQLNEMTLGVLGMGRVGQRVGRIASLGFGMKVIFHDIAPVETAHWEGGGGRGLGFPCERVTPERLYRECDILTIHTDMREGNYKLVGKDQIALMKRGSVLVNHARGELLDEHAVADALKSGQLGGAAIDVFDPEPPGNDLPLLNCPNTLLTPHMAARTSTAIENMSWVVRDVMEVLRGGKAKWPAP